MASIARKRATLAGVRTEIRNRPVARGMTRLRSLRVSSIIAGLAVVVVLAVGVAGVGAAITTIKAQEQSLEGLRTQVSSLQGAIDAQPDWAAIARRVEPSVFTIETAYGLGSGWVARAGASGCELVTHFPVIDEAWSSGVGAVGVRQGDWTRRGVIERVDRQHRRPY